MQGKAGRYLNITAQGVLSALTCGGRPRYEIHHWSEMPCCPDFVDISVLSYRQRNSTVSVEKGKLAPVVCLCCVVFAAHGVSNLRSIEEYVCVVFVDYGGCTSA